MAPNYNLSPAQQKLWAEQLSPLSTRGLQTKIANALERGGQGTVGSWKTTLSLFFQGGEKGLRAVFEHDDRVRIVAKVLGVSPEAMRRWLDIARGLPVADAPGTARIPGFEDFGAFAIEDTFFPPRLREARYHLPRHGHVSSSAGGNLDLDQVVAVAASTAEPRAAKAIVLVGARGSGRTPALQALVARLRAPGLTVTTWGERSETASAVVVDDLDELEVGARATLIEGVTARQLTLLCTVAPGSVLDDLPAERALVMLAAGDEAWARAYLEHLDGRADKLLARPVDTSGLRDWIASAPDSTTFFDSADVLGLAARHVADGGKVPLPLDRLLELAVARWAKRLRADGRGPEALMVELCLGRAMTTLAATACRHGGWSHTISDVARALVDAAGLRLAGDADGPWGQLGAPGMLSVVDGLMARGFFARRGDELEPTQRILQAAALGIALADSLEDFELLINAIVDPRWHDGLVVCAQRCRDSAPLLRAVERLPVEVRVHAYAAVTRLLASEIDCSDGALLNRWFQRCLRWWAATPAESRSMTMTIGGTSTADRQPIHEALIGGTCPLLVLSRASKLRRHKLRGPRTLQDLEEGEDLPEDERRYLGVFGRAATEQSVHDALLVGAPFQCELILDPISWRRFPSAEVQGHELPGGLTREEYATWWRTTGVERLRLTPDARARITGTLEGWSITWGMTQPTKAGARIWGDALLEALREREPAAAAAFAEAVAFLVRSGGRPNFEVLTSVWNALGARERRPVWEPVAAALPPPEEWFIHDEFNLWLIRDVLQPRSREEWWSRWTSSAGRSAHRIPWRAFATGGLPAPTIVAWAVETMPDSPRAGGGSVSRIPSTGGGLVLQLHEPEDAPQAAALDFLLESDNPETLAAVLDGPDTWSLKALARLGEVAPDRARLVRFDWAADEDEPLRGLLLTNMSPRRGEREQWQALAQTADSWHERLVRWAQVAVASEGDDRWQPAADILTILELLVLEKEVAQERLAALFAADGPSDSDESPTDVASELVAELHGRCSRLLAEFGNVLAAAPDPDDGLRQLVRRVLDGPLRPHVTVGGLWLVAWRAVGFEYVVDRLLAGHGDQPDGAASLQRLQTCTDLGLFDVLVRRLLLHEVLGRAATRVFAQRIAPKHVDLIRDALEDQPLQDDAGGSDASTVSLARKLASIDARAAVTWAEGALAQLEPSLARTWWESMLPTVAPGPARRQAVSAWARTCSRTD